jgi:hypothetical protein
MKVLTMVVYEIGIPESNLPPRHGGAALALKKPELRDNTDERKGGTGNGAGSRRAG